MTTVNTIPNELHALLGAVVAGEVDEGDPEVRAAYLAHPHLAKEVAELKLLAGEIAGLATAEKQAKQRAHRLLLALLAVAIAAAAAWWLSS